MLIKDVCKGWSMHDNAYGTFLLIRPLCAADGNIQQTRRMQELWYISFNFSLHSACYSAKLYKTHCWKRRHGRLEACSLAVRIHINSKHFYAVTVLNSFCPLRCKQCLRVSRSWPWNAAYEGCRRTRHNTWTMLQLILVKPLLALLSLQQPDRHYRFPNCLKAGVL